MPEITARDTKLIQYLNEAYGKEKELETSLTAHIAMNTRPPYKKRLQEHLRETKRHAREVERRIKQLGGKAEVVPAPGPDALGDAASAVASAANRAVAAAKGPLHMIRGTGEEEKLLKNVKTEYLTRPRRSPPTPRSRRWPRRSAIARRLSWLARSSARRSECRASSGA